MSQKASRKFWSGTNAVFRGPSQPDRSRVTTTAGPQRSRDGPIAVDVMTLMMGQRQLQGSSQEERSDLHEALQLVASGKATPALETYPLAEANAVRERLAAGKVRYRAVSLHARWTLYL